MEEKWYSSGFGYLLGFGLLVGVPTVGIGIADYLSKQNPAPMLQTADLNGNGVQDKFYTLEGRIAVVEMDGRPVLERVR